MPLYKAHFYFIEPFNAPADQRSLLTFRRGPITGHQNLAHQGVNPGRLRGDRIPSLRTPLLMGKRHSRVTLSRTFRLQILPNSANFCQAIHTRCVPLSPGVLHTSVPLANHYYID